jgi:hypothetical protein
MKTLNFSVGTSDFKEIIDIGATLKKTSSNAFH